MHVQVGGGIVITEVKPHQEECIIEAQQIALPGINNSVFWPENCGVELTDRVPELLPASASPP